MKKKWLLVSGVAALLVFSIFAASPAAYAATNFYWTGYGAVAHWNIPITYNGQPATIPIIAIFMYDNFGRSNLYISAAHPGVGKAVANIPIGASDFSPPGPPETIRTLADFNFGNGLTEKHLIEITWIFLYSISVPDTAFVGLGSGLMVSFSQGVYYPNIAYLRIDAGSLIHPGVYTTFDAMDWYGTWDINV